jgi:hypothetical protein
MNYSARGGTPVECPKCSSKLVMGKDISYMEAGYDGEGIVSIFKCLNDDCNIESVRINYNIENESNRK